MRQHPLLCRFGHDEFFYFIPDFYCHQELLIIELDGSVHDFRIIEDGKREGIIRIAGYKIIRFKNEELVDINKVLEKIENQCND